MRSWRRPATWVAAAVAVVATAGGAAAAVLQIDEVRITGLSTVPPSLVAQAAGLGGGERLLLTRMAPVQARVEALPQIRRVRVERRLPGTVVVAVEERVPLLRLANHGDLAADQDGRIVPVDPTAPLPVLIGWTGDPAPGEAVDHGSAAVLLAYPSFPEELRRQMRGVVMAEGQVELVLTEGVRVLMGRTEGLEDKAEVALVVLAEARESLETLEYVDVRTPRAPVARAREDPAGSPPAASPVPE